MSPTSASTLPALGAIAVLSLSLTACGMLGNTTASRPQVTLNVADAAMASGAPDLALRVADMVLAKHPDSAAALTARGDALYAMGQAELAGQAYRAAVKSDPKFAGAQIGLGRTVIRTDPKAAEAAFLAAATLQPDNTVALSNLGVARDLQKHHAAAQEAYRAALAVDPDMSDARVNLGLSLALSGQAEAAVQILQPLARQPGATQVWHADLAVALAQAGDLAGARRAIAMPIQVASEPDATPAPESRRLGRVRCSCCLAICSGRHRVLGAAGCRSRTADRCQPARYGGAQGRPSGPGARSAGCPNRSTAGADTGADRARPLAGGDGDRGAGCCGRDSLAGSQRPAAGRCRAGSAADCSGQSACARRRPPRRRTPRRRQCRSRRSRPIRSRCPPPRSQQLLRRLRRSPPQRSRRPRLRRWWSPRRPFPRRPWPPFIGLGSGRCCSGTAGREPPGLDALASARRGTLGTGRSTGMAPLADAPAGPAGRPQPDGQPGRRARSYLLAAAHRRFRQPGRRQCTLHADPHGRRQVLCGDHRRHLTRSFCRRVLRAA